MILENHKVEARGTTFRELLIGGMVQTISYRKILSSCLILYLIGLTLAHTAVRYSVVLAACFVLVMFFLPVMEKFSLSRHNLIYYLVLLFLINLSSLPSGFSGFLNNLLVALTTLANIFVYEVFARTKLDENQVHVLILAFVAFSVTYCCLTSRFETLFFLNRNSVPLLILLLVYLVDLYLPNMKTTKFIVWCFGLTFTFLSKSRAGLLALLTYLVMRRIKSKKVQFVLFCVLFSALILLYVFGFAKYFSFDILGKPVSDLSKRDLAWFASYALVISHPFGMGYANYTEQFLQNFDVTIGPHNVYLNILLQFGWFYFVVYMFFLSRLVGKSRLNITTALAFSVYLRAFFESGTPFGLSLNSAILILPFYLEKGYLNFL